MAKEVRKIVDQVLDRKVEDKHVIFRLDNLTAHNSAIGGAGDVVPLIQQIPTGTGSEGRIGDRIVPKFLNVSGVVSLAQGLDRNSISPIMVRVVAYRQNDVNVGSQNSSVDTASLFRDTQGGTGARGFTGIPGDLLLPMNDDKFKKIYDRQFQLSPQLLGPAGNATTSIPMTNVMRKYAFKVKLPKQFKYDTNTGDWANNFAPFMSIGYAYVNGQVPDTTTTLIVNTAVAHLVYEDA